MGGAIGMVLSGGGARGAYEFGALEVLAPVLDEPPRLIVGTSAGGLGAAYLAANAHAGLEAAARSRAAEGAAGARGGARRRGGVARGRARRRDRPVVLGRRVGPPSGVWTAAGGRGRARTPERA